VNLAPRTAIPETIDDDPTFRRKVFTDRRSAGRLLAEALAPSADPCALVLGLARGGVVVADEVARSLGLRLDVWLVRKLGIPFRPEVAMGALSEGAKLVLDRELVAQTGTTPDEVRHLVHRAVAVLRTRADHYRHGRPRSEVKGRPVILVDDGITTGRTIHAAVAALRSRGASWITVAAPVGTHEAIASLRGVADEVVCLVTPADLRAVGSWYEDFHQVSDREVVRTLDASRTGTFHVVG
jgi:predicted phosphoribosyltransferase